MLVAFESKNLLSLFSAWQITSSVFKMNILKIYFPPLYYPTQSVWAKRRTMYHSQTQHWLGTNIHPPFPCAFGEYALFWKDTTSQFARRVPVISRDTREHNQTDSLFRRFVFRCLGVSRESKLAWISRNVRKPSLQDGLHIQERSRI